MSGAERGAASVELVAVIPLLVATSLLTVQFVIVLAAGAALEQGARAGARAAGLGHPASAVAAAVTATVPGWLREEVRVQRTAAAAVRVEATVPTLLGPPRRVAADAILPVLP